MARIAFFTESLPPTGDVIGRFAWNLIHSLADQQHEIRVFSTYRSEQQTLPASHSRIEVVRPFRKWGLTEIPKIIPSLLSFRPDVIHVVQPHKEALTGLTNAMDLLPTLKPLLGKVTFVASLFDVSQSGLRKHRALLPQLDAITVSNREQRDLLMEYFSHSKRQPLIEVVPLGFARLTESGSSEIVIEEKSDNAIVQPLLEKFPLMVAVGGPVESHSNPLETFKTLAVALNKTPNSCAVVLGGWGPLPIRVRHSCEQILFDHDVQSRVLLTGDIDEQAEAELIARATCVISAPLAEGRLAYTRFVRSVQHIGRPLILSLAQADLDPIRWQHGENALVCAPTEGEMSQAIGILLHDEATRHRLQRNLAELSRSAVADQPGNLVSRLYVKTLT